MPRSPWPISIDDNDEDDCRYVLQGRAPQITHLSTLNEKRDSLDSLVVQFISPVLASLEALMKTERWLGTDDVMTDDLRETLADVSQLSLITHLTESIELLDSGKGRAEGQHPASIDNAI